jgi:hypothetical protein
MTPKQMKYLALFGLIVVVLFLATFMSMRVTEGFRREKKCNDSTKPFWNKKTTTCVDTCPPGTYSKGRNCIPNKCSDAPNLFWNQKTKTCVDTCPPGTTEKEGIKCIPNKCSDAPNLLWDSIENKCVAACPAGFSANKKGTHCRRLTPAEVQPTQPVEVQPTQPDVEPEIQQNITASEEEKPAVSYTLQQ